MACHEDGTLVLQLSEGRYGCLAVARKDPSPPQGARRAGICGSSPSARKSDLEERSYSSRLRGDEGKQPTGRVSYRCQRRLCLNKQRTKRMVRRAETLPKAAIVTSAARYQRCVLFERVLPQRQQSSQSSR
jgi:hypothetical protein